MRELRLATAAETSVEIAPSANLDAAATDTLQAQPPLFSDFTNDMLLRLGVPQNEFAELRALIDANALECMTLLLTIVSPDAAPRAADAPAGVHDGQCSYPANCH